MNIEPSTTASIAAPVYVSLRYLAETRWGVSVETARNKTREPGFPAPMVFGPRTKRWPLAAVDVFEAEDRGRTRRVMTGLPQHRVDKRRTQAVKRTRTIVKRAAA